VVGVGSSSSCRVAQFAPDIERIRLAGDAHERAGGGIRDVVVRARRVIDAVAATASGAAL